MTLASIASERLELVSLAAEFLEAVVDGRGRDEAAARVDFGLPVGWPERRDEGFLRLRARQLRADPSVQEWLVRAIVLPDDGRRMVGTAGFHGPPGVNALAAADAVELGYSVLEPYRGLGYATEAVRALIRWAGEERGIRRFLASVAPDNAPSLAIVRKLRFVEVGRHWDEEDGEELEFELRVDTRG